MHCHSRRRTQLARILSLGMTLSVPVAWASSGVTIHVPRDWDSIQNAVFFAPDGAVVLVAPGVYAPFDFLGRAVTVRSVAGPGKTIIDGGGLYPVVGFGSGEGRDSVLEGFTISGGFVDFDPFLQEGGAGMRIIEASPTIVNCWITENIAVSYNGGGVLVVDGSPRFVGCRFFDNLAEEAGGGAIYITGAKGVLEIEECEFVNNRAAQGEGGAISISRTFPLSSSPLIRGCVFLGNEAESGSGGAIAIGSGSPRIEECDFLGNLAPDGSGGAVQVGANPFHPTGAAPRIDRCRFLGNAAPGGSGGALASQGDSAAVVTNSLFEGNDATDGSGGAVSSSNSASPRFVNCTIVGNGQHASNSTHSASATFENSIIWGNEAGAIGGSAAGLTVVRYSIIQGGFAGQGNLNVAPTFVDARKGDFRLAADSAGIDAGDTTSALALSLTLDLAGGDRYLDDPSTASTGVPGLDCRIVDIGAFEFVPGGGSVADLDGDGNVDGADLGTLLGQWGSCLSCSADLNCDGVVDGADLGTLLGEWGPVP